MKCPECGKFLGSIEVKKRLFDERIFVKGICKTHGEVEPTNWDADMFRFEGEEE